MAVLAMPRSRHACRSRVELTLAEPRPTRECMFQSLDRHNLTQGKLILRTWKAVCYISFCNSFIEQLFLEVNV